MKEISIEINDAGQRVDRFLKKYLKNASLSFIYKSLRKKNILVNDKKAKPEDILKEKDKIKIFFSDETLTKFIGKEPDLRSGKFPRVIYEDDNIILLDKPAGILSHNDSSAYVRNMVDMMVDYLIAKGDYNPRLEKTFRPSICNRLDRNTSGILIAGKNAASLREINDLIRRNILEKYYLVLVKGEVKEDFKDRSYLVKDSKNNKVSALESGEEGKLSLTEFKVVESSKGYSLLEVKLITGRTHQIRTVLKSRGLPILGDIKYGRKDLNKEFESKYGYRNQFLHNYKIKFADADNDLAYLKGREFYSELPKKEQDILRDIFQKELWR
ncbi:RluA family pseudouridine synthase [Peptoniphilus catoniae]|uniref:RluA family pseudouridine synthase n=1 Tax=Peptoniphilus catoniae TaxID=1660341 RepID=UPI0010FF11B6|nr:RluA family pseudouridine synthase [Peptoniphilus catoniae]